jgi:PPOX class probable F420-dependent enzyme
VCAAPNFDLFQDSKYLSLESFRKNGQGVQTPVWFAADPAAGFPRKLYVYSVAGSGKAKRIRRNSRVRIAPCNVRGTLLGDWIDARAEILAGEAAARGVRLLNQKYKPWKQLLDFFAKFRRREHVIFAIHSENIFPQGIENESSNPSGILA